MPLSVLNRARRNASVLEKFYGETNITRTEEGAVARSLWDAVRSELEAVEDRVDSAVADANPLTAIGPYLELWLEWFDIERQLTRRAHARAEDRIVRFVPDKGASTFGDLNAGQPISIGSADFRTFGRTRLFTDRGLEEFEVEYELLEDVILDPGDSEHYVSVMAIQPGVEFNIGTKQLADHTFTDYATYPDRRLKIENLSPITNGEDDEDDDRARYRMSRIGELRPKGFVEQISSRIDSIPGISDVIAIQGFSGSGSVDFFVDTQSFEVPDALLNEAREVAEEVNSHGTLINIDAISRVGISIEVTVKFKPGIPDDEKSTILNNVELQITNEVLDTDIGESIDLEDLYRRIGISYGGISSLGVSGRGFDTVTLYREGLFGQRVGETISDTLSTLQLSEIERILPESSLLKPFTVRESTR
jgi:hypothetical protein